MGVITVVNVQAKKREENRTNKVFKDLVKLCGKGGKLPLIKQQVEELKTEVKTILEKVGIVIEKRETFVSPDGENYITINNKTRKGSLDLNKVKEKYPEIYETLMSDETLYKEDTSFLSFDEFGIPNEQMIKEYKKELKRQAKWLRGLTPLN